MPESKAKPKVGRRVKLEPVGAAVLPASPVSVPVAPGAGSVEEPVAITPSEAAGPTVANVGGQEAKSDGPKRVVVGGVDLTWALETTLPKDDSVRLDPRGIVEVVAGWPVGAREDYEARRVNIAKTGTLDQAVIRAFRTTAEIVATVQARHLHGREPDRALDPWAPLPVFPEERRMEALAQIPWSRFRGAHCAFEFSEESIVAALRELPDVVRDYVRSRVQDALWNGVKRSQAIVDAFMIVTAEAAEARGHDPLGHDVSYAKQAAKWYRLPKKVVDP